MESTFLRNLFPKLRRSVKDDLAADFLGTVDDVGQSGSAYESAQRRADRRALEDAAKEDDTLQERLDAFLAIQEEYDEDGDFTEKEQEAAKDEFLKQEKEKVSPAVQKALDALEVQIPTDLEAARRLVPTRNTSVGGEVLALDADLIPVWDDSVRNPDGSEELDLLAWDDTTKKWVVFEASEDLILYWSSSLQKWQTVTVPADDGKFLQTYTGSPPLKFDYPTYSA